MPFGWIKQSTYDADIRAAKKPLLAEIAATGVELTNAKNTIARLERKKGHAEVELAAANARLEWLEHERDALRPDAEKYRAQRAKAALNLKQNRKAANGASVQGVVA